MLKAWYFRTMHVAPITKTCPKTCLESQKLKSDSTIVFPVQKYPRDTIHGVIRSFVGEIQEMHLGYGCGILEILFKEEGNTLTPIIQAPFLDLSEKRSNNAMEGVPGVLLHEKHNFRNKFQFWALYVRFWVLFVSKIHDFR